jgi:uncharacterized membrane protein YhaH (DUF805 family)
MTGSLESPPIVVTAARWPGFVLLGLGLFVTILMIWVLSLPVDTDTDSPDPSSSFMVGIGLGVLVTVLGLAVIFMPQRLEIGPQGIERRVLWRRQTFAWTDVFDFRAARFGLRQMVGYNYTAEYKLSATTRQINAAMMGMEGVLGTGYGMKATDLAQLLNEARERWLAPGAIAVAGAPVAAPGTSAEAGIATAAPGLRTTPPGGGFGLFAASRLNRKVFWICIGGLFGTSILLSLVGLTAGGFVSFVFLIRIFTSRLHDFGRTGWWVLAYFAGLIVFCILAGVLSNGSEDAVGGAAALVQLVFVCVLGAIRGQPEANRFGPAPGQPSPMAAAESFR